MTHTPTPWARHQGSIESVTGEYITQGILEDNAALIVNAVNSYEVMLKALKGVLHHNEGLKPEYKMSPSLVYHVRKAIALAEGKDGVL